MSFSVFFFQLFCSSSCSLINVLSYFGSFFFSSHTFTQWFSKAPTTIVTVIEIPGGGVIFAVSVRKRCTGNEDRNV